MKEKEIPENKENILKLFIDNLRQNLHFVLSFSPIGS